MKCNVLLENRKKRSFLTNFKQENKLVRSPNHIKSDWYLLSWLCEYNNESRLWLSNSEDSSSENDSVSALLLLMNLAAKGELSDSD